MSRLKVYHNGDWVYADSTTQGVELPIVTSANNGEVLTVVNGEWDNAAPSGGGTQPDFVLSGTTSGAAPTSNEIESALSNIVFNSTMSEMLTKVQTSGDLDVGGCFCATLNQIYYKSIIDYNSNIQIIPQATAQQMGFPVESDVITLTLSAVQAIDNNVAVYCGIAVMNGAVTCVALGN